MIHVEGLTKYYGDICAVDHIDLDIHKGEIVGLLGPNGAGKTTTLRMLTGYFTPSAGRIQVKDSDMNEDPLSIKQSIGYLPESAPLYQSMLVYDYLDHVARIRGLRGDERFQRLQALTDLCGLREIMHKPIATLSKGLKQRVGLAHAMMSDPEILVLDEPTSGLDPNQIVEIREIIRRIGTEKTVILSTHILSEAEATCDRIVIINKGRIIVDGTTRELTTGRQRAGRIQLALQGAEADAARRLLETVTGVQSAEIEAGPDGAILQATVTCRPGTDVRADLYGAIKATDWVLLEMIRETQTLETLFGELTRES
ncbi:ABC transporter ATP-binding protein [Desulfatitalea alkaliphila]|uniref:ABC transporter ATP-binding protein n=1 Tax=Desulfatitalea alkaliphila TaxID=2929485 RepID=A0AA41UJJ4_9BACT|nr:ATP-binding cassette domain-containing protein [Desulfatitalea alkaliphila]MCJ8501209.1 ABC transporter ATP-binding protein [Desulfatitalea alkaliphila]